MDKRKQTVLIVDDVHANTEFLTEVLGDEQKILVATSGQEAFDTAVSRLPDLILLDILLPDQDGYEICTRLKKEPATQNIPIIFVTALDQEQDEERGLRAGAIDYITKPFRPPIVRARVRNHLELKRYRDLLENLSTTDELTGIPNRRQFDHAMDREWRRGLRNQSPISLVLMDVDCFKAFNDHYGHLAGDDCLRQVAGKLVEAARRPGDVMARLGGEEFVSLLPETDHRGALVTANRIQQGMTSMRVPHAFSEVSEHVTLSIGLATMIPTKEHTTSDLIKRADEFLYLAKHNGRNQIAG